MGKSVFDIINENTTENGLDPKFVLPVEGEEDAPFSWAPGAQDGVAMYHMPYSGIADSEMGGLAEALKTAADGNYEKADALFYEWTKGTRAIHAVDDLHKYVIEHASSLDPTNILNAALTMLGGSEHVECVKIGLELLELFQIDEEEIKDYIRQIALYDEFTLFAIWNMKKWESSSEDIFKVAKKVHGWGRIHAVRALEPTTDEMKHWLLTDGTINYVEHAYSSLICWQKSDAEDVLFKHPTLEEYRGLITLIEGLLDEGPVAGFSQIENADKILLRFLEIVPDYKYTEEVAHVISSIKNWAEYDDINLPAVVSACCEIQTNH